MFHISYHNCKTSIYYNKTRYEEHVYLIHFHVYTILFSVLLMVPNMFKVFISCHVIGQFALIIVIFIIVAWLHSSN